MVNVEVRPPAGPIKAVLEVPAGDGPWPGVVVVHDMTGLRADTERIARKIADNGYLVIAPDLFARGGIALCVKQVITELYRHEGRAFDDILAARDLLAARHDCTGNIGVAGFCMGGGFALVCAPKGFAASAPFYPSLPLHHYKHVLDGACPIVASMAGRDRYYRNAGPKLARELDKRGIEHDVESYDADHSFANDLPVQPLMRVLGFQRNPAAAEQAWQHVFALFGKHLAGSQETRSESPESP